MSAPLQRHEGRLVSGIVWPDHQAFASAAISAPMGMIGTMPDFLGRWYSFKKVGGHQDYAIFKGLLREQCYRSISAFEGVAHVRIFDLFDLLRLQSSSPPKPGPKPPKPQPPPPPRPDPVPPGPFPGDEAK